MVVHEHHKPARAVGRTRVLDGIGVVGRQPVAPNGARVDDRTQLAIERNELGCALHLVRRPAQEIRTDSQCARHRDHESELEADRRAVPQPRIIRDPGTHRVGGVRRQVAVLDRESVAGTGLVARPEHVAQGERAVIDAPSARATGLHHNMRKLLADGAKHAVVARGVLQRPLAAVRVAGSTAVAHRAIHVPLDVRDRCR